MLYLPLCYQPLHPPVTRNIDTIAMKVHLPQSKLTKAWDLVAILTRKQHTTLHELQSVTSYLAFCVKVILVGWSFLCQLYDATTNPNGLGR